MPRTSWSAHLQNKVPDATVLFWIIKVMTTGMGETTSDYLVTHMDPMIAVSAAGLVLLAVLAFQFSLRRYVAWAYWLTVIMVSVFGTMAADVLHIGFSIPYLTSATFFAIVLALIFVVWHASEKTLSIHSITTRRRETFYWATILTTFALGTATGDMTATTMHLGYFSSGLLFAGLIALPAIGYWKFRLNGIFAFWCAYILTRPLGASFADWAGVPVSRGGLGWGTGPVSLWLLLFIVCAIAYQEQWDKRRINKIGR